MFEVNENDDNDHEYCTARGPAKAARKAGFLFDYFSTFEPCDMQAAFVRGHPGYGDGSRGEQWIGNLRQNSFERLFIGWHLTPHMLGSTTRKHFYLRMHQKLQSTAQYYVLIHAFMMFLHAKEI